MTTAVVAAAVAVAALVAWRLRVRRERERIARACHEIRGPLTAAHLVLDASARRGELSPARAAALELELRRASLAVDDLGGESGGRSPQKVDVAALLACQAQTWREVARAHGRDLELEGEAKGMVVRADAVRLAQAVGNVLANAIEHGAGTVALRTRSTGDRVRVEVSDGGRGLPAPVAQIVRRPRAGRGRRGRGLAIAAAIVERHGGSIATAPSARGACVAIDLPAMRE